MNAKLVLSTLVGVIACISSTVVASDNRWNTKDRTPDEYEVSVKFGWGSEKGPTWEGAAKEKRYDRNGNYVEEKAKRDQSGKESSKWRTGHLKKKRTKDEEDKKNE